MNKTVQRGQIWYARLIGEGSVQSSQNGLGRPVIVVSNYHNNLYSPIISIIPLTSRVKRMLPTHVMIGKETGLIKDSIALAEQIQTIDKEQLQTYTGVKLNDYYMQQIEFAIMTQLGIQITQNSKAI